MPESTPCTRRKGIVHDRPRAPSASPSPSPRHADRAPWPRDTEPCAFGDAPLTIHGAVVVLPNH
ncbi:hypothetical protein [Streptomyces sp. NRRL F-5630]|uniref:hypothetical protein n=1 Tax=unclassified Streptomyces TaxID=2593676 RepID=UPI00131EAFC4|nr:hypothetical protein [Streptomyces sp. NRRL F-5630]